MKPAVVVVALLRAPSSRTPARVDGRRSSALQYLGPEVKLGENADRLRLDPALRAALDRASEVANEDGFDFVGVGHLLVALLEANPTVRDQCTAAGLDADKELASLRVRLGRGNAVAEGKPALSPRLRQLLDRAISSSSGPLGVTELLGGLPADGPGVPAELAKALRLGDDRPAPGGRSVAFRRDALSRPRGTRPHSSRAMTAAPCGGTGARPTDAIVLARESRQTCCCGEAGRQDGARGGLAMTRQDGCQPLSRLRIVAIEPSALSARYRRRELERRLRTMVTGVTASGCGAVPRRIHSLMGLGHESTAADYPASARAGRTRVIRPRHARFVERDAAWHGGSRSWTCPSRILPRPYDPPVHPPQLVRHHGVEILTTRCGQRSPGGAPPSGTPTSGQASTCSTTPADASGCGPPTRAAPAHRDRDRRRRRRSPSEQVLRWRRCRQTTGTTWRRWRPGSPRAWSASRRR